MNLSKKLLAVATLIALVIMNTAFFAANAANEPTPIYTTNGGAGDDTLQITVPNAGISTDGDSVTIYVKNGAGVAVDLTWNTVDYTDANTNSSSEDLVNWQIVVTAVAAATDVVITITTAGWDFATWIYSTSYNSTADNGATLFYVNSGNSVTVTATVVPILTMALNSNAIDFGELNVTGDNTSTTDSQVTVSTNATSGLSISVSTTGWDTGTTANVLWAAGTTNTIDALGAETDPAAFVDANEYFWASLTLNAPAAWATLSANNNFSSADNGTADRANDVTGTLATTSGPTDSAQLDVTYHAGINAVTEAGNYSSTVIYSVTGSF